MSEQKIGRSAKAFRNVATGLLGKIILLVLVFFTRTIFIRVLGAEYTGVNSLYSSILFVLSLAELGLGNVFLFYLYPAIKENDKEKLNEIVFEFRTIYRGIVLCILILGVVLIPFLQFIIKSDINHDELILFYILHLINTAVSYLVIYRTMVLTADQKNHINNISSTVSLVAMYILQSVYLLVFRDFIGYLVIQIICSLANNLALNYIARKKYPFLKAKNKSISDKQINKRELLRNIKATFLFRFSDTILDQTDSIIISVMFGTIYVGYYYNYNILVTYIIGLVFSITNNLLASFGSLHIEGNMERSYGLFRATLLGFAFVGTFCAACYSCVVQDFISIWIGSQYLMGNDLVFVVVSVFFMKMISNPMWIYRSAMGLFKEVQYINVIAAVLNVILSIILGHVFGMAGVIIATMVARLFTSFWYEGKVLFGEFGKPVHIYYLLQLKHTIVAISVVGLCLLVANLIAVPGVPGILIKVVVCFAITVVVEYIVNYKTVGFDILKNQLLRGAKMSKLK